LSASVPHLYVHVPFCHHICPYCGFYKHQPGKLANRAFVDALVAELRLALDTHGLEPRFETIFFGGGTPTLLSPAHLERLLTGLRDIADLSGMREWTFEANPATFDLKKAALLRDLGVNRVSLGVQSWQAATLATLGRDHSPAEAEAAYDTLREAGFASIGIDLMFSVPGQTMADWRADLEKAVSLAPEHISAYNLTYEEDTEFLTRHQRGELDTDEDRDADLFFLAIDTLEAAGFRHYEISNYARPGHESLHNQAYWSGADYLGIGPGAVSTVAGKRWKSLPDTAAWIAKIQAGESAAVEPETLTAEDRRLERIALQLRTEQGILADETGSDLRSDPVASLIEQGLIEIMGLSGDRLRLTRTGKALADSVAAALV
jgi:oxygen-independent coproporphyrinogen-3 oxidase